MSEELTTSRRFPRWTVIISRVVTLLLLAFVIDAAFYEPFRPVLTTYDVAIPGLPRRLDGFRVVQLSDLHRSLIVSDGLIRKAVAIANSTNANVAVVTGDFVSRNAGNAAPCCGMLKKLRTRYGTFAVLGNHDYWTNAAVVGKAVTDSGITLLTNTNARLPNGLCLVGIDDEWSGRPDEGAAFEGIKASAPCIVLCHEPTSIKRFRARPVLALCGHTHGGVINIPGLNHVLARFARCGGFISGWYSRGQALMYVNRGIGTVFPPLRFRSRPEVTLFILHPTERSRPYVARSLD
jgi:predicted MPP superfamily phosphohydrolase